VVFHIDGNAVRITKAESGNTRGSALLARMRGTATTGLTTEEILALTRE
jgi:hypothetical protein